jgi:uncharacterized protein (DUF58 family)
VPSGLPLVPGFIARFFENWASRRLPDGGKQTTLVRQRIYILPTRAGMAFFTVLLVILFGAINYENSLAFMLTFLLGAIGFLGMVHTHQNINHLKLTALPARPVFAGQQAQFPLVLAGRPGTSHLNIKIQCGDQPTSSGSLTGDQQDTRIMVTMAATHRGQLQLEKIKVFSEFPLGLFHAWSWVQLSSHCLVYPAPDDHAPRFRTFNRDGSRSSSDIIGNDDFAGIRGYQKGDAPNHLAWKAVARTGELQTKVFHADAGNEILLSWYGLADTMDVEKRLSVLCRWVLDADHHGLNYGLELPGIRLAPDLGQHHRQVCLRHLALYGLRESQ